ncbi:MAG: hemerythrin [Betaproteobacteria bacterium HGW-Betaproteobacteria-12]|jgi:hemerythrin|nr:MAG: hemerythrin [Betaproteobacteria bacterium HGW-Betaproteobacteria-12]
MEATKPFVWDDRYLLGHGEMDATHREFVDRVNALLTADDAGLGAALAAFAAHAAAHFAEENEWMVKNDFPPRDCHIDEHNKVLASVHEVQRHLAEGDVAIVRELAVALMEWFPAHADYLDSALATWLVKRLHAGAPLVLRRNVAKA